jgi:hypothetical protein
MIDLVFPIFKFIFLWPPLEDWMDWDFDLNMATVANPADRILIRRLISLLGYSFLDLFLRTVNQIELVFFCDLFMLCCIYWLNFLIEVEFYWVETRFCDLGLLLIFFWFLFSSLFFLQRNNWIDAAAEVVIRFQTQVVGNSCAEQESKFLIFIHRHS